MSSTPPEAETHEVTLCTDEQWVVHHVLSKRIDAAIDNEDTPPEWTIELFETIESGEETLTGYQAARLYDALEAYLDRDGTPQQDVVHGSAVLSRLEEIVEPED